MVASSERLEHLNVVLPKLHTLMFICRQRTRGRGRKLQSIIGHLGFGLCRSTYTWISFSVNTTVPHIPWLVEPLDLEEWATWIGRVSCETWASADFGTCGRFWNQPPVDTEGWLCVCVRERDSLYFSGGIRAEEIRCAVLHSEEGFAQSFACSACLPAGVCQGPGIQSVLSLTPLGFSPFLTALKPSTPWWPYSWDLSPEIDTQRPTT